MRRASRAGWRSSLQVRHGSRPERARSGTLPMAALAGRRRRWCCPRHSEAEQGVAGSMGAFIETKRTLDGREQRFETRAIAVTSRWAAVRFDFAGTTYARAGGFEIPPGSYTLGFFWRDRTYNLYHISRADGAPIADRFDVVEGVRIRRDGLV